MPEARLDGCLQWAHLSSGHTPCNRSVDFFRECFYSPLTCAELRARMPSIVDSCGCHASKQSDSRDRGLVSSLPIPYCANSLLYVDFIYGLPTFGGYDSCLVVTCCEAFGGGNPNLLQCLQSPFSLFIQTLKTFDVRSP